MNRFVFCWLFLIVLLATVFSVPGADLTESSFPKVVVLGIAQDGGIPQIGCTQKICLTQHHFVSALAILNRESIYLIDATPDLRAQYKELIHRYPKAAKKSLLDGIFLTHAHMGHYTGLMYLGKESISTQKTPVYCSEEMSAYLTRNGPWSLLVSNGNIDLRVISSGQKLAFGDFSVTPVAVPHRKEFTDTYGFLIQGKRKTFLYVPDIDSWEPIRESLSGWLKQSDFALLDGTFYSGKELPGRDMSLVPHPTIQSAISFFSTLPSYDCRIYFTHLNHTNPLLDPDSAESKEFARSGFRIAAEWSEFEL